MAARWGGAKSRRDTDDPKDMNARPLPDLGPQVWVSGNLEHVSFHNCVVIDALVVERDGVYVLEAQPIIWSEVQHGRADSGYSSDLLRSGFSSPGVGEEQRCCGGYSYLVLPENTCADDGRNNFRIR